MRPHRLRRAALRAAAASLLLVLTLVVTGLSGCCDRLFYYPSSAVYSTPAKERLSFEAVTFPSADGTVLTGWFLPAVGAPRGTVVHCHGNAENMTSHWRFAEFLVKRGYNLFVFDYRGYGQSAGTLSRKGTVEDALAAVGYVLNRKDVDRDRVALFGQSLGGAIATVAAAKDGRVRALVLDSAFASYRNEAAHALRQSWITYLFSWPLSRILIRSGLDPAEYIGSLSPRPVLIIHGAEDRVVPCEMSQVLLDRAGEPKTLWVVERTGHTGALYTHGAEYENKITGFLEQAFSRP